MAEVKHWVEICEDFEKSDLLLGNGFSINIDPSFSYDSLFQSFLQMVDNRFEEMIKEFSTNNFEFIMQQLNSAQKVNRIFDVEAPEVQKAADFLKEGLIRAVEKNHPRSSQIKWNHIDLIADQILTQFEDIFTLNYDIYLYHIILKINEKINEEYIYSGQKTYADGFWKDQGPRFKEFPGHQDYDYRMVYYLHGALFIFKKHYSDQKLIRGNDDEEIINLISGAIKKGNIPLFVSEGNSSEKRSMISRSTYLNFCFRSLRTTERDLVIYGATLGTQDRHIAEKINNGAFRDKKIAYGMYVRDKNEGAIGREIDRIKSIFGNLDVTFFDSSSLFEAP